MQTVKVTAPAHFAAFCVAINEPFYFLNGAYYLLQWQDPETLRAFCADNGVRPRDLEEMTFTAVDLRECASGALVEYDPAEVYAELDAASGREYNAQERKR